MHIIGIEVCFIKNILESLGKKCGLIGTVKNTWGDESYDSVLTTPEPMELQKIFSEMVKSGCEYCVMEVSSQALDQRRVDGIHFDGCKCENIHYAFSPSFITDLEKQAVSRW